MERPVDAVAAAVLRLEIAQRRVTALVGELTAQVSADPSGRSSFPEFRVRLSELRSQVNQAADELIDAFARMGEESQSEQ